MVARLTPDQKVACFMDSSHSGARSVVSHNSVSSDVAVGSSVPSGTVFNAFAEELLMRTIVMRLMLLR
ncbi:hypothetical protein Tco_1200073, partial [Tanacetum coccineum]